MLCCRDSEAITPEKLLLDNKALLTCELSMQHLINFSPFQNRQFGDQSQWAELSTRFSLMTKICSIFLLYFCTYIFCLYKNTKKLSIKRMTMKIPCMLLHVTVLPVHYSKNDFIIILTRWGCILVSIYFLLQPLSDVSS